MIDVAAALAILTVAGVGVWCGVEAVRASYEIHRARRRADRRKGYVL
jgi:chloramphenicol 3-O-phosphotransferase